MCRVVTDLCPVQRPELDSIAAQSASAGTSRKSGRDSNSNPAQARPRSSSSGVMHPSDMTAGDDLGDVDGGKQVKCSQGGGHRTVAVHNQQAATNCGSSMVRSDEQCNTATAD